MQNPPEGHHRQLNEKTILLLQGGFILAFVLINLIVGVFPSVELLFSFFILIFIWRAKDRRLLIALLPFCILLLTFQSLRGFADNLSPSQIHITDLIDYEKRLFGGWIPAYVVQATINFIPGHDILIGLCNILYLAHFVNPLLLAILVWFKRPSGYWYFAGGMIFITYFAFVVYYLYPAAPPWWATKYGYLTDQPVFLNAFFYYPQLAEIAGPNPVAAMPSLHMAYPTFIALVVSYYWRRWTGPIMLLPLLVAYATLLLGHHYIIDLIAGAALSIFTFAMIYLVIMRKMAAGKPEKQSSAELESEAAK